MPNAPFFRYIKLHEAPKTTAVVIADSLSISECLIENNQKRRSAH